MRRNRSVENVRLRVGPNPLATLITSNLTKVRSRFSCNMRTPKAYVATTTTHIGIKRDPAKLSSEQSNPTNRQSLKEFKPHHCDSKSCSVFSTSCFIRSSARTRIADINSTASHDGLFTRMKLSVPSVAPAKPSSSIKQPENAVVTPTPRTNSIGRLVRKRSSERSLPLPGGPQRLNVIRCALLCYQPGPDHMNKHPRARRSRCCMNTKPMSFRAGRSCLAFPRATA